MAEIVYLPGMQNYARFPLIGGRMAEFWTQVTQDGRLVVPADIRKRLGLTAGGSVRVTIETFDQSLREAQDLIAQYVKPGVSLADELSAERRDDAKRE